MQSLTDNKQSFSYDLKYDEPPKLITKRGEPRRLTWGSYAGVRFASSGQNQRGPRISPQLNTTSTSSRNTAADPMSLARPASS